MRFGHFDAFADSNFLSFIRHSQSYNRSPMGTHLIQRSCTSFIQQMEYVHKFSALYLTWNTLSSLTNPLVWGTYNWGSHFSGRFHKYFAFTKPIVTIIPYFWKTIEWKVVLWKKYCFTSRKKFILEKSGGFSKLKLIFLLKHSIKLDHLRSFLPNLSITVIYDVDVSTVCFLEGNDKISQKPTPYLGSISKRSHRFPLALHSAEVLSHSSPVAFLWWFRDARICVVTDCTQRL